MPSSVDSPLPSIMAPTALTASTNVTPTSASIVPTVTTTIQPIQQRDTTWTKLFVGGLPYHTTDKSLRDHFEVYGDIEEAVVITDRSTGKSRGYGFVIMSTKDAAERACKEPNPIIDGRKANVNLAILGAKPRGNLTAQLPLAAIRPTYPGLVPGQYGQPVAQPATHPYLQQLYAAAAQQQAYGLTPNIMQLAGLQGTGNPLLDMYSQYAAAYGGQQIGLPAEAMIPVTQQSQSQSLEQSQLQQQLPQSLMAGQSQAYAQALQYAYAPNMLTAAHAQQLTAADLQGMGIPAYAAAAGPAPAAASAQQTSEQRIQ